MTETIKFRKSDAVALLFSIFLPGMGQIYMNKAKVGIPLLIAWFVISIYAFGTVILRSIELTAYGYVIEMPEYAFDYVILGVLFIIWMAAILHTNKLVNEYNSEI